ncbi:hypothetical protein KQI52_15650 [bacterium]|nr:hypothetical protein [bacterium]
MRKTLVLHIGMHKTATTSIQSHLLHHRVQLHQMGVEYVPGLVKIGRRIRNRAPMSDELVRELQAHLEPLLTLPAPIILGSAEAYFGRFMAKPPVLINSHECAADLKRILEPFDLDVKLFAAVRRQDTWLESAYQHSVKWNFDLTFDEWYAELDLDLFHWDRLLGGFAAQFGKDNLYVHPYERLFKPDGEGVRRLYRLFGAEQLAEPGTFPRSNPGISKRWLEVLRRANSLIDRKECQRLRFFMEQEFPRKSGDKTIYFSDEQRVELLEHYSASNQRLFDEFVPAGIENFYTVAAVMGQAALTV